MLFPLFILLIFSGQHHASTKSIICPLLIASIIYLLGYVLIFYAPRYAYFTHLSVFISFVIMASSAFKIPRSIFIVAIIFFIVFFSRNLFISYSKDFNRMHIHQNIFNKIEDLKQKNINGRVCLVTNLNVNKAKALDEEQFGFIMVNYFLKNQLCGVIDSKTLDSNMVKRINRDSIKYVFAYDSDIKQKLLKLDYNSKIKINNNGLEIFVK
jgi:hypothetical protein